MLIPFVSNKVKKNENMVTASILSIGDEICIGQIVNSNAAWIANKLTLLGVNVMHHSSVMDNSDDIKNELTKLRAKSDIVIITGGLGPTHDDITKQVLTEYFDDKLIYDVESFKNIERFLISREIVISESNRQLAYLPSKCIALKNDVGTAPGMLFDVDDKVIISLPGVPLEMMQIFSDSVIPYISNIMEKADEIVLYKVLQTTGIPESMLAEMIGNVDEFLRGNSLAFLPSARGVRLRIGVTGENFAECDLELNRIENEIFNRAGKYIYGYGDESITGLTAKNLKTQSKTISVAESCTGGLLGGELTSVPGSSEYFMGGVISYSNDIKIKILGVKKDTIENYGAVSMETASEMSERVRILFTTDIGVGITGIAGPEGGTEKKPVGTVWISLSDKNETITKKYLFGNTRNIIRERAVVAAQKMILDKLRDNI